MIQRGPQDEDHDVLFRRVREQPFDGEAIARAKNRLSARQRAAPSRRSPAVTALAVLATLLALLGTAVAVEKGLPGFWRPEVRRADRPEIAPPPRPVASSPNARIQILEEDVRVERASAEAATEKGAERALREEIGEDVRASPVALPELVHRPIEIPPAVVGEPVSPASAPRPFAMDPHDEDPGSPRDRNRGQPFWPRDLGQYRPRGVREPAELE